MGATREHNLNCAVQALNLEVWGEMQLLNPINLFAVLLCHGLWALAPGCSWFHAFAREAAEAEYRCHPHAGCGPEHCCERSLRTQPPCLSWTGCVEFPQERKTGIYKEAPTVYCWSSAPWLAGSRRPILLPSIGLVIMSRQCTSDGGHLSASHSLISTTSSRQSHRLYVLETGDSCGLIR